MPMDKNLKSKILAWIKKSFFEINLNITSKIFSPKFRTCSSRFLKRYSLINEDIFLELLRKFCFTKKDVRAGWFGAGLPKTENNKKNYKNLANWATEHLYMYFAFLPFAKDAGREKNILDVGCGIGYATLCLADSWPKSDFVGIDYDQEAIRIARLFNSHSNITYIEKDFFEYKPKKLYDYIFALEVLEHVPANKHDEFIERCMKILSPSGKLFLSTPNALDEKDGSYSHIGLLNRRV